MEPKIKSKKELVIKAKEEVEQVETTKEDWYDKIKKDSTRNTIPMSNKQKKARAASKRAKVARKVNRK